MFLKLKSSLHLNVRHNVIGPFQFLIATLIVSESLLIHWMLIIAETESAERIIVGALSITVLIAVLVIFTIIYYIKKSHELLDK